MIKGDLKGLLINYSVFTWIGRQLEQPPYITKEAYKNVHKKLYGCWGRETPSLNCPEVDVPQEVAWVLGERNTFTQLS